MNRKSFLAFQVVDQKNAGLLHYATRYDTIDGLELLLEHHVPIDQRDEYGNTPLHYLALAPSKTHTSQMVDRLLERAQPYLSDYLQMKNREEQNALELACQCGHYSLVEMLLTYGASRSSTLAMQLAIISGHNAIVALLMKCQVPMNGGNSRGQTPWHLVCQYNRTDLLQLLFQYDDDLDKQDDQGFTALLTAGSRDHRFCVEQLLFYGADLTARDHRGRNICTRNFSSVSFKPIC